MCDICTMIGIPPTNSCSAFLQFCRLEVPEQALDGIPLGFGLAVDDKPKLSCRLTGWRLSR